MLRWIAEVEAPPSYTHDNHILGVASTTTHHGEGTNETPPLVEYRPVQPALSWSILHSAVVSLGHVSHVPGMVLPPPTKSLSWSLSTLVSAIRQVDKSPRVPSAKVIGLASVISLTEAVLIGRRQTPQAPSAI